MHRSFRNLHRPKRIANTLLVDALSLTTADQIFDKIVKLRPAIVSFDFFDTLVYRTVLVPTDVFLIQADRLINENIIRLTPHEWLDVRASAERAVSDEMAPREIVIDDIYREINSHGHFVDEAAMARAIHLELAAEREVIALYSDTESLLSRIKRRNIKIYILSDTYLPRSLLTECMGNTATYIDNFICSSDSARTKRHGHAFESLRHLTTLVHFGDNLRADWLNARKVGIRSFLVKRDHAHFTHRYRAEVALLRHHGIVRLPPDIWSNAFDDALGSLALRWAIILYDYLAALREYARVFGATDLWLLSRDCESLWDAIGLRPDYFHDAKVQYVRASRRATHPIAASLEPAKYTGWHAEEPSPGVPAQGELASEYYQSRLCEGSRRVLVVDMTARARIQYAISLMLPDSVSIGGFYFSLQRGSERSTPTQEYFPFARNLVIPAAVEMLSGFSEGSCIGFERQPNGAVAAVLQPNPPDTAPDRYISCLRGSLGGMIATQNTAFAVAMSADDQDRARAAIVRQVTVFTSRQTAEAIKTWEFSDNHASGQTGSAGGSRGRLERALGLSRPANPWPSASVHWVLPQLAARFVQWGLFARWQFRNLLARRRLQPKQTAYETSDR